MPTVYPRGVTIYYPDKCFNGYTILEGVDEKVLIDMNGNICHRWNIIDWICQPPDSLGNLLTYWIDTPPPLPKTETGEIQLAPFEKPQCEIREYDWDSWIIHKYYSGLVVHHDVIKTDDGNVLAICEEPLPDSIKEYIIDPARKQLDPIYSDYIVEVTSGGDIVWEWHAFDYLDINRYCSRDRPKDWLHTNTVQPIPATPLAGRDSRFRIGNILLTVRNLDEIILIDKETKAIVWRWGEGVLDHPHHAIMQADGKITIFDNGMFHAHGVDNRFSGTSRLLVIDPIANEIEWQYYRDVAFFTPANGSMQRLPNGNYLVTESLTGRIFELTPDKETVWEYIAPKDARMMYRAFRIPYDHCPQTRRLPKPSEEPVIPGKTYRLMAPLDPERNRQ